MKAFLSFPRTVRGYLHLIHGWGQLILLVPGLFLASAAFGQTELWKKNYGGPDGDFQTSFQQTSDGGYILGGYSYSDMGGDKSQDTQGDCIPPAGGGFRYENCVADFWVVKLDSAGNKQWDKTFGGAGDDRLVALQQTSDGGYILGGTSFSGLDGDKSQDSLGWGDYWVIKLDSAGSQEWDKTFGGTDKDELASLRQASDGGYIVGGTSYSDIGGDKSEARMSRCDSPLGCTPDYWVLKLDEAGNKEWDKTLGGRATEYLVALQQATDGGYILGGYSYSGANGNKTAPHKGLSADFWLVKLDATGAISWDKSYGSTGRDLLTALELTSDGGYIVGGHVQSGNNGDITGNNDGDSDYWILKLDADGNKQWDKTFGGRDTDFLNSVHQTSDGGYILGGRSDSYTFHGDNAWGRKGYWVIKLDPAGSKQWDKPFNFDIRATLHQTSDGDYVLGGTVGTGFGMGHTPTSQGQEDYQLLKISGGFEPLLLAFDAFSPGEGLPGSTVTITGKNLGKTRSVWFYGGNLKKAKFRVLNDDTLTTTVPHSAKSGKIFLYAVDDTLESADPFLVLQPLISDFSPGEGPVGTTVTLNGHRLGTTTAVYFNEVPASAFTVVSDEQLTAVVPESAATGPIRVLLQGGGEVTTTTNFSVSPSLAVEVQPGQARKVSPAVALAGPEAPGTSAFPNPFNHHLTYRFSLSQPQTVTVQVYDLLGREVQVLYQGEVQAHQAYQVTWQPKAQQSTGFYLIRLRAAGQDIRQKVLLAR